MVGMSDCVNSLMLQRDDDNGGLAAVIEGDQMHCRQDDVIGCWDGVKLRVENDDEECSRAIDGDHMHCSEGLHIGDVIGTVLTVLTVFTDRRSRTRRGHQSPWLKIAFLAGRDTVTSTRSNCRKMNAEYFSILATHSCVTVNIRANEVGHSTDY
jgi:hypothetical protein